MDIIQFHLMITQAVSHSLPLDIIAQEKLARIFAAHPDIQAVYVFGSMASGRAHGESDLDLGIVLRPGTKSFSKLDLLADLAVAGFDNVDVALLDTANILLKYEAVRHNRLIYHTPDFDKGTYYSLIIRQYLDFLPYLTTQRRAYKRRALHGQA